MATWTDEEKDEAKELYLNANPTAETTTEIVKDVAETMGKTANGIRMVINKMKDKDGKSIYIKAVGAKNPPASSGNSDSGDKPKRVSKEDAMKSLIEALEAEAIELSDEDKATMGRATGKYNQLIITWISILAGSDDE